MSDQKEFDSIGELELMIPPDVAKEMTPKDVFLYKIIYKLSKAFDRFVDENESDREALKADIKDLSQDVFFLKKTQKEHAQEIESIKLFHRGCEDCRKLADSSKKMRWLFDVLWIGGGAIGGAILASLYILNEYKDFIGR